MDRQTEVDAYALTAREARRIGLTDDETLAYLLGGVGYAGARLEVRVP